MKALFLLALVFTFAPLTFAQDWNQWRGPERNGLVSAKDAPKSLAKELKQTWKVDVGEGYSSPVVSSGRVFINSRRDPNEVVMAIDLKDGKVIWEKSYQAVYKKNQYAVQMAKGPNSTPLVIGNRVFTLGVSGIIAAWDTRTGEELWKKDFSNEIDTSKLFCGTAASPIAVDGRVVVQVGSDIHGGRILSLDPAKGTVGWEWRGPGPGYSSPVLISVAGSSQLVTMTQQSIIGLDAKTGKELWSIPFADEWNENIVTPVWTGSTLIVSGTRQGTHAFDLKLTNGKWQATELWANKDVAMYMSSPVYGDGLLYGHSSKRKGQFVAVDVKTGTTKWATEGREGEHASVLLTPTHVVFLTNGAELIFAKRGGTGFVAEQKYEVAKSPTWSVPVFLGSDLLVRDASSLIRLSSN